MSEHEELMVAAVEAVAKALRDLGTANADTPMGGLEMVAKEIMDSGRIIADGLTDCAKGLEAIAQAIKEHGGRP